MEVPELPTLPPKPSEEIQPDLKKQLEELQIAYNNLEFFSNTALFNLNLHNRLEEINNRLINLENKFNGI